MVITARGDLLFLKLTAQEVQDLEHLLDKSALPHGQALTKIRSNSFACVALPTCGQALAEAERFLPTLLEQVEQMLEEIDLGDLDLDLRMTGCPNGCARPYLGEIGIVGRSKRSYDIFVGANRSGTRLNTLFGRDIPRDQLVVALRPLFEHFRDSRDGDESFGDFVHRLDAPTFASLQPVGRRARHITIEHKELSS
jgi:sulfite reductase beta subunit-like hemoprotein